MNDAPMQVAGVHDELGEDLLAAVEGGKEDAIEQIANKLGGIPADAREDADEARAKAEAEAKAAAEKAAAERVQQDAEARQRANEAFERAEQAEREVRELRALVEKQAAGEEVNEDLIAKAEEMLKTFGDTAAEIKEDAPSIAAILESAVQITTKLRDTVTTLQEKQSQGAEQEKAAKAAAEKSAQQTEAEKMQAAVEKNATLKLWVEQDPYAFSLAKVEDEALRKDEKWLQAGYDARYAEVVARVQKMYPGAKLPVNEDDAKAKAAAAKAAKDAEDNADTSLSDIPGGVAPTPGPLGKLQDASVMALHDRMMELDSDRDVMEFAEKLIANG